MNVPFDWKEFNRVFQQQMKEGQSLDFSWIDEYVRNAMQEAVRQPWGNVTEQRYPGRARTAGSAPKAHASSTSAGRTDTPSKEMKKEIFEIHNYVIVKLTAPEQTDPKKISVSVNPNRLKVLWLERQALKPSEQTVSLPVPVMPEDSKAIFKGNILEIRLPKQVFQEQYTDIPVLFH